MTSYTLKQTNKDDPTHDQGTKNRFFWSIFCRKIEKFRFFSRKNRRVLHAPVRRVAGGKIGHFSPIFSEKNPEIMALILFYVFDPTVQISSAFLKESNSYIFYPTVDFKSKA